MRGNLSKQRHKSKRDCPAVEPRPKYGEPRPLCMPLLTVCSYLRRCTCDYGKQGVFLELKMKDKEEPEEILQAAKYTPYLEIVFGEAYEVIPALVLTAAKDKFDFSAIGKSGFFLPDKAKIGFKCDNSSA